MRRAAQLPLCAELGDERPASRAPDSVIGGTNADVLAQIGPVYLAGGPVVDLTYGLGKWWDRWRPAELVAHDLRRDGVRFEALPWPDGYFAAAVFDPPYTPSSAGTGAATFRHRYGLTETRNHAEVVALVRAGALEALRVVRRGGYVVCKVGDYTNGRVFRVGMAPLLDLPGSSVHDVVVHASGGGAGSNMGGLEVLRTRRAHSYVVVLRRRFR